MSGPSAGSAELLAYLECQKENIIRDTRELIKIPSVCGRPSEVARALGFLLERASDMGFQTRTIIDGQAGIVEYGEGDETVGILVHVDVVPAEDADSWHEGPFSGTLKDGEIWGRGALDDKGPAVAALYAMKAVKELGVPMHKKIQYIIGTKEESDWAEIKEYVDGSAPPDFGFTPDGDFPIGNLEHGTADVIIKAPVGSGRIRERIIKAMKTGIGADQIPKDASVCLLSNGKSMVITGDGVSERPTGWDEHGNAIGEMCGMLMRSRQASASMPAVIRSIGGDRRAFPGVPDAAAAVFLEIKGDQLTVSFHARFATEMAEQDVRTFFEALARESEGAVIHMSTTPVAFVARDRPFIKMLAEAYEEVSGLGHYYVAADGGTYAKAIPNTVSFGPLFPGDKDLCHLPDERIGVEHLMRISVIYAEALRKIVSATEKLG